jgi:hypothetical protein
LVASKNFQSSNFFEGMGSVLYFASIFEQKEVSKTLFDLCIYSSIVFISLLLQN